MVLSEEQVARFRRDGFLVVRGAVEALRCDAIRDAALVHMKYKIPPVETEEEYVSKDTEARRRISGNIVDPKDARVTLRRLRQVYDRDILFREWMEDPFIRPALYALLGEMPVLTLAHHNSIMTKMPHRSSETRWHQDMRYWHFEGDNLLSVWLALQHEYADNGVLEFIPESHHMTFGKEQFDEKLYFREDIPQNRALIERKVSLELQKGDVVFFHAKLLHRADKNRTDEPKVSLVYTVKGASVRTIEGTRSAQFREVPLPIAE